MQHNKLILLVLILLPFTVYWPTRSFDLVWDDEVNVAGNPYLNPVSAANVIHFWQEPYERLYIPISYTVWAAIAPFATVGGGRGFDPAPFHMANLFFHVLSTLVVFAILRLLIRRDWAACAGALLFALHPVQVEPVAWITGMKDVLSGLLSLVAVWQYLSYSVAKISLASQPSIKRNKSSADQKSPVNREKGARLHYAAAMAAFILALLAKPTAVVTPVIALILDHWALKRPLRESAIALAGWIAVSLPFVAVTKLVQPESELEFVTPLWARPLVAADALAFYLYKLLLPLKLAPDYGRLPELVIEQKWIYFTWAVPCALSVLIWFGKQHRPWLVAAAAVFVVGMLPVSGLVPFSFQNTSTVADRYLYISMFGPALALAWFLSGQRERAVLALGGALVALLGIMSLFQARHWQNNVKLFSYALKLNPGSWTAHYSLGRAFVKQGKNNEAIASFREAARLQPDFTNAYFSLGSLLATQGKFDEATAAYREALKIAPSFVDARFGLGNALALRGDLDAASQEYRYALRVNPNRGDIYFSLGNLLAQQGRLVEAAECFGQVIRLRPDFVAAHHSLGRLLAAQGDLNRATDHFREAVRIDPGFADAHESLALALAEQGKIEEAQRHVYEAKRLKASRLR